MRLAVCVAVLLLAAPGLADAPKPEAAAHFPLGIQRGAEMAVTVRGKNLQEVCEVKTSTAGLTGSVKQAAADQVQVQFRAAAEAPLEAVEFWLVAPGGETARRKLFVDALPQTSEQEPNSRRQPTALAVPAGAWGQLDQQGDVDCYSITAKQGETIVVELAATRLGSKLNAVVTVFDAAGKVLAASNDFDNEADPLLAMVAPHDGVYTIQVSDLQIAGSAEHYYRLTVGSLPYVVGCYPPTVAANSQTEVELLGFNLPPGAKARVQAGTAGEAAVMVSGEFRLWRPLFVAIQPTADVLEVEPNEAPAQATAIAVPGAAVGRIGNPGDADLFRFSARQGQTLIFQTQAAQARPAGFASPVDTRIEILDASGLPVPRLLLQATRDSYIDFRPIDSRSADIRVANWEEMDLNEFLYMQGEVCKLFRAPQGPDSGFVFYQAPNNQRRCYFDTSGSAHALGEAVYIVQPLPPKSDIIPNGLPVFTLHYANDDDGERQLGNDSRLTFTAPADGEYLVRVTDDRGLGGARFVYRLLVRNPAPDFRVNVGGTNPTLHAGSGKELTFTAERRDGFEGEIAIDVTGLPAGFTISSPIRIEEGHVTARATLFAASDAVQPTAEAVSQVKVAATATINGREVVHESGGLGTLTLADKPQVVVRVEPAEVTIQPGTTVTAMLKIERNGNNDPVRFDVNNLPHGVIVDNIGLNGVLIPPGATERRIFLTARPWVGETRRPFHAVAQTAGNQASPPAMLHVRRHPGTASRRP